MTSKGWLTTTFALLLGALGVGGGITWFAIRVATSRGFPHLLSTPYNQVENYAFSLGHEDCEIVIFGDSSAMTGVDPIKIEGMTNHKTCNISQTQPTVVATGTLTVDLYLKQNTAPRYLVIQLSPDTFYQAHGLDTLAGFDPIMLMLRHDPGYGTAKKLLLNASPTLRFLSLALQARYRPNRVYGASFMALYAHPIADYYAHKGFLTMPLGPERGCGRAKPLGVGGRTLGGWRRRGGGIRRRGLRCWCWFRLFRSVIHRGISIAGWMAMWMGSPVRFRLSCSMIVTVTTRGRVLMLCLSPLRGRFWRLRHVDFSNSFIGGLRV